MRQILIDKFILPESAVEEFTEKMNYNRSFIKKLPGFIEDTVYKRLDENGNAHIITTAVWESEEALSEAKTAVQAEYKRIGFNPPELLARLNAVSSERGIYTIIDKN